MPPLLICQPVPVLFQVARALAAAGFELPLIGDEPALYLITGITNPLRAVLLDCSAPLLSSPPETSSGQAQPPPFQGEGNPQLKIYFPRLLVTRLLHLLTFLLHS